jgi:hypothetical protein
MLELTLAAMIGALVLLAALSVFSSMDRGDRVLSARAEQNSGLELASGAIERAIGTLVMDTGGHTKTGAKNDPKDGTAAVAKGPAAEAGRARFLLETDTRPELPGMPDVAEAAAGTAGSAMLAPGSVSAPQRLELVVARHPAPVDARPAVVLPVADGGGSGPSLQVEDKPAAVRGAFDLRPEARKAGEPTGAPATWTLWWRPIERRVDESGAEVYAGADDLAVPLARGLISARWSVYYEEAWKTSHATAVVLDLPAYVKLQVTTAAGLQADWLFEVGWIIGPEFKPPVKTGEDGDTSGADATGDSGLSAGDALGAQPSADGSAAGKPVVPSGPPRRIKPGPLRAPKQRPGGPARPPPKAPGASR